MNKLLLLLFVFQTACISHRLSTETYPGAISIEHSYSTSQLGACQGVSYIHDKIYFYGDAETGIMQEYELIDDSIFHTGKDFHFTIEGKNVINHPTGIAYHPELPVFIGNSVRLNKEGTSWKAIIYCIDWEEFLQTGTLDGHLLQTIEDDICIQGTRPEYVEYKGKHYVATADYGGKNNEVRLYDPIALQKATHTTQEGVLVQKFNCSPWVQNLHWIKEKDMLVLIQNPEEGKGWRLTFLDFSQSLATGTEQIIKIVDFDRKDELEGFCLTGSLTEGLMVTSSRRDNLNRIKIK